MARPFFPLPLRPMLQLLLLDAVALGLLGGGFYLNNQQPGLPLASLLFTLGGLALAAGALVLLLWLRPGKSFFNPPRT